MGMVNRRSRGTRRIRVAESLIGKARERLGFSLVELLVVVGIIGILISMLMPAVQAVRESGRQVVCRNNLRQIGFALLSYESTYGAFPSFETTPEENSLGTGNSWSIHGRLFPFLEQSNAAEAVDLDQDWHSQVDTAVTFFQVPTYICPSEVKPEPRIRDGEFYVSPHNYGFNLGTWLVYDPRSEQGGDGSFVVNRETRIVEITGGTSSMLAASEVRAYQAYLRNTPTTDSIPESVGFMFGLQGDIRVTGPTVWPDGRAHHSGFTSVFAPNTAVELERDGELFDADYTSQQEGKSHLVPTKAAITSRSYHAGLVNSLFVDSSVHGISDAVEVECWRRMSTRNNE